jgi:lipopolysaccharide/colanic/teichoic acid biosynthesis glycosyltransferase
MEPDILATPSVPVSDAAGPGASHPATTKRLNREALAFPVAVSARVSEAAVNGHAGNGHALNGHALNGHALNGHNGHALSGHALGVEHPEWSRPAIGPMTGYTAAAALPHITLPESGFYLRFGKRAIDTLGALAAMVLLAPVMAVVAVLIKLESRGPVFYRSCRIGRNGRPFVFLKFRSMFDGADRQRKQLTHLNEVDGPVFKISRDPRVTTIGRLLRVTSLDEIPQFLNVLMGEMSLVGPRPPIPEEVEQYEPWQLRRLDVKPGITCLWQISGRSTLSFREWMRLDLEYIKHRSFWLDLRILIRTIPAVLSREGAY